MKAAQVAAEQAKAKREKRKHRRHHRDAYSYDTDESESEEDSEDDADDEPAPPGVEPTPPGVEPVTIDAQGMASIFLGLVFLDCGDAMCMKPWSEVARFGLRNVLLHFCLQLLPYPIVLWKYSYYYRYLFSHIKLSSSCTFIVSIKCKCYRCMEYNA